MIKRERTLSILHLVTILFWMVTIYFCNNRDVFIGTNTKTTDCYILQVEKMNTTDSHVFVLEKDDVLSVEYSIDRGNVDLVIGLEKEKPIYKGNDIEDGKFEVIVPRDGEYRITVKAKHAAGSIVIIKNQCMDEK